MASRSIDTSADGPAATERSIFDTHIDQCEGCTVRLCWEAQTLWRNVCMTAIRANAPKGGK